MLYTLREVAAFCHANKRRNGFRDHTLVEIQRTILAASDRNNLHIVEDDYGICGVVLATEQPAQKRIYIHHIVAVRSGFATLVKEAFKRYPGYSIVGKRRDKLTTYTKRNLYGRRSTICK